MTSKIYTHLVRWNDSGKISALEIAHESIGEAVGDICEHFGCGFEDDRFEYITTQVFNMETHETEDAFDIKPYLTREYEECGWKYMFAPF